MLKIVACVRWLGYQGKHRGRFPEGHLTPVVAPTVSVPRGVGGVYPRWRGEHSWNTAIARFIPLNWGNSINCSNCCQVGKIKLSEVL